MPWVGLQYVSVVFPDHTHFLEVYKFDDIETDILYGTLLIRAKTNALLYLETGKEHNSTVRTQRLFARVNLIAFPLF